jgi:small-conductance mechanosensitive channel
VAPQQVTVQAAAARFASAQSFLGYSQVRPAVKSENKATSPSSSEVEELHAQLQQIMVQMVKVQQALSTKQNEVKSEAQVSAQEQAAVPATWTPLYVVK